MERRQQQQGWALPLEQPLLPEAMAPLPSASLPSGCCKRPRCSPPSSPACPPPRHARHGATCCSSPSLCRPAPAQAAAWEPLWLGPTWLAPAHPRLSPWELRLPLQQQAAAAAQAAAAPRAAAAAGPAAAAAARCCGQQRSSRRCANSCRLMRWCLQASQLLLLPLGLLTAAAPRSPRLKPLLLRRLAAAVQRWHWQHMQGQLMWRRPVSAPSRQHWSSACSGSRWQTAAAAAPHLAVAAPLAAAAARQAPAAGSSAF